MDLFKSDYTNAFVLDQKMDGWHGWLSKVKRKGIP